MKQSNGKGHQILGMLIQIDQYTYAIVFKTIENYCLTMKNFFWETIRILSTHTDWNVRCYHTWGVTDLHKAFGWDDNVILSIEKITLTSLKIKYLWNGSKVTFDIKKPIERLVLNCKRPASAIINKIFETNSSFHVKRRITRKV